MRIPGWLAVCLGCLLPAGVSSHAADSAAIRFGRDILPILSANCYACHGPDEHERQADLRLDLEADAKRSRESGLAIDPGKPDASTVIQRLESRDEETVMPPPDAHKKITPEQIAKLRLWISQGAPWGKHWALEPIERPEFASGADEAQHPIDYWVDRELSERGLARQGPAPPQVLVRRLWLDLIGVPPTPEIADAFAADPSEEAYVRMVNDLLESPKFGEHWARMWLDLARYADTKGYEKDLGRTMWPYRDWVVDAFNADMPLDQFTLEQLAGDLIPNATQSQLIATAFHRNTMCNDEGGTDDEEFRIAAVKDRIDTTVQVWMGLTMGCAKCHSHKYDPISQTEYYQFFAIFNQTEDADRFDDSPRIQILDANQEAERARLKKEIEAADAVVQQATEQASNKETEGTSPWKPIEAMELQAAGGGELQALPDRSIRAGGKASAEDTYTFMAVLPAGHYTAFRLEAIPEKYPDGQYGLGRNQADPNFVVSEFTIQLVRDTGDEKLALTTARADYSQDNWPVTSAIDGDAKTGWAVSPRSREKHEAIFGLEKPLDLPEASRVRVTLVQQYGNRLVLRRFRVSAASEPEASLPLLQLAPEVRLAQDALNAARDALKKFEGSLVNLPILRELPEKQRRATRIHQRGNFLEPGDEVSPNLLSLLGNVGIEGSVDRAAVARWLVHRDNPLTPRVWVNRVWSRLFGTGIVETEEDFGALGAAPTHPELLDWLAAEYRDEGWSLKRLLRLIVLSQTYRQDSRTTDLAMERDPRNLYLSRGARYRLSAEVVRDQALAIAGLLSDKRGGPPVMPPQPAGIWRSTYNGQSWMDAEGEDRYRRGIYTYLKRTTPFPSFLTFDGGSGEVCQIRRIRTNTPLQALVLLNDPVYTEAAAALAKRMVAMEGEPVGKIRQGMRIALVRPVAEEEAVPFLRLWIDAKQGFGQAEDQARTWLQSCRASKPESMSDGEFAAWILVASALINLDETLSRN